MFTLHYIIICCTCVDAIEILIHLQVALSVTLLVDVPNFGPDPSPPTFGPYPAFMNTFSMNMCYGPIYNPDTESGVPLNHSGEYANQIANSNGRMLCRYLHFPFHSH